MSGTIPASAIVSVTPSVLSAGGAALDTVAVMLSSSTSAPTTVTEYASAAAVATAFGATSVEAQAASVYFAGYTIGTKTPGKLYIVQAPSGYTPATLLTSVYNTVQDWTTIFAAFTDTQANQEAIATWMATYPNRFVFVGQDTDASAITTSLATSALMSYVNTHSLGGVFAQWAPSGDTSALVLQAAFVAGFIASLDFTRTNGRATVALKSGTGITATVTNQSDAANLITNGYNFYGAYSLPGNAYNIEYPGQISGEYKWLDSYVDQIWMTNQMQVALMTLLTAVNSIPYNQAGYALIEAALSDPINAALNFGAIRPGVTLSNAQVAEINQAAGKAIASDVQTKGYYLLIQDASAQTRTARQSPPITLWYADGQSVQSINLASIEVQ